MADGNGRIKTKFKKLLVDGVRNGLYKPPEFHGRGTGIINMGELFKFPVISGEIDLKKVAISDDEFERFSLRSGDLLFARRSLTTEGAGKVSYVSSLEDSTVFESSIIRARPNKDVVEGKYLYYYFNSILGRNAIRSIVREVAVAGITGSDLLEIELTIPDLKEQRAIIRTLMCFDDKIKHLREQNETLDKTASTLFSEWFGKYRTDEELPAGWQIGKLTDIATFLNGLALQRFPPESEKEYLPVIKIRELKAGITDHSDKASKNIEPKYIIRTGDVLFSWSGSLEVGIWHHQPGALNQHLFKVSSDEYPKWFYYFWTRHHLQWFREIAAHKATTMGHIQRGHLDMATVVIPDSDSLSKYSDVIEPLFEKTLLNAVEIQKLGSIRDTLLPKLMSGELRVGILDS